MATVRTILFLGYPQCGEQDTLAPAEMLKSLAWKMGGDSLKVELGTFEGRTVTMQMGTQVVVDRKIAPDTLVDLLYVPGGVGSGVASKDQRILEMIQRHSGEGRWVATNCSGIGILHRSGILKDTSVTAAATVARKLHREGTKVATPRKMWICVPQRQIFTAAGGSAVHPSTVALAWHLFGDEWGRTLSLMWDTLGAHGKALFDLEGPEYGSYPQYEAPLQDEWEPILLPD